MVVATSIAIEIGRSLVLVNAGVLQVQVQLQSSLHQISSGWSRGPGELLHNKRSSGTLATDLATERLVLPLAHVYGSTRGTELTVRP